MSLLGPDDPPPFRAVNAQGRADFLLLCDHAGKAIPKALHGLGLLDRDLSRHIGWDIGAAKVAERLSALFDAQLVMSTYSRLVIDCNRRLDDPTSIPQFSDGTEVPGNRDLSAEDRAARAEACFWPYHRAIGQAIAGFTARGVKPPIVIIHSFTPVMNGFQRPWQFGILWDGDRRIAPALIEALRRDPTLTIGDNQPYSGSSEHEFTLTAHTKALDLPRVSIEVRQDLIGNTEGAQEWADKLAPALAQSLGIAMRRA